MKTIKALFFALLVAFMLFGCCSNKNVEAESHTPTQAELDASK